MTKEKYCSEIQTAVEMFCVDGKIGHYERYGNGHINDTFVVECRQREGEKRYILQRINHKVFLKPQELMRNVEDVTSFLRKKIQENKGDPERETLNLVPTKERKFYYRDSIGCYWRMYHFIEGTVSLEQVRNKEDFYQSAVAFGRFQSLMADFDSSGLYETIPNFHNTPIRYQSFLKAIKEDVCGRAVSVQKEIDFYISHKEDMELCQKKLAEGLLPLRVTHNDTKLNNILFDGKTQKGICVIDLDTVMPGLAIFDFGDAIRFGANTAAEDETDVFKVSINLELFEIYVKGYLEGCNGSLSKMEIEMLPFGVKTMTLECGMRFLTDYLQGDRYFRVHRERHNLDRCRTQIALIEDMEKKWDKMQTIALKYC